MIHKKYYRGTHRVCSPEETFNKIQPLMANMGITRIANVTGLDEIGLPVVTVCRPDSRAISVAQGKGLNLISAKVSGLMEAIETYHGEHIELPLRLASYRELKKKHHVVDVTKLVKISLSRFHEDLPILWLEGKDLISQKNLFIPYEIVHCDYTFPLPAGSGCFMMSTNGLASGNHLLEAIIHGLCEVIERDALSLWKLKRKYRENDNSRLDLSTIDDESCLNVLKLFQQADVMVGVWNVTSDIDIPSFYCMIMNEAINEIRPLYPAIGIGTHPEKSVALLRALTEAAQSRLTLISGSRDDATANEYAEVQDKHFQKRTHNMLAIHKGSNSYRKINSWNHATLEEDMALIRSKLTSQGFDNIAVVDLSKNEFDISVVRVVVPGLEGIPDIPGYVLGERALKAQQQITEELGA